MILFRSEPVGEALEELLAWGRERGARVGFVVDGGIGQEWKGFLEGVAKVRLSRSYPGSVSLDPVLVVEMDLTEQTAPAVLEIFQGRLFGPGDDAWRWAQDLFLVDPADAQVPLLSTVTAELVAVLDLTPEEWREVTQGHGLCEACR